MDTVAPDTETGERPQQQRRRNPLLALLLVAALLAAVGYGYWTLIYYPTTPQHAVDQFIEGIRAKDFDRVYSMVKVPAPLKVFIGSGSALKAIVERNRSAVPEIKEHRFGNSDVVGDQATVETTIKGSSAGSQTTSVVQFKLVRTNGVWLIDGQWIMAEMMKRGLGGMLMNGPD